jgi:hypothetical protein
MDGDSGVILKMARFILEQIGVASVALCKEGGCGCRGCGMGPRL